MRRTFEAPARAAVALVMVAALTAVTGCGVQPPAAPQVTVAPDMSRAKIAPPVPVVPAPEPKPAPPPPPRWPLTGERADKVAKRPAVAVKIENAAASRPHTGLHRADIVWEQVVEGGISRFVAVYHSDLPGAVGPIRSVRPMDPATVAPLDGILAASGGQTPFLRAVEAAGTQLLTNDDGDKGFWRSGARSAPHNVYGDVRVFTRQANKKRTEPPPAQFRYADRRADGSARDGKRGREVDVRLSRSQLTTWTWNGKAQEYRRSDNGRASMSSGKRVDAHNVLVIGVDVSNTRYRDPTGVPVPKTELVGKGKGALFGGGKVVTVRWEKKRPKAPLKLTRLNGDPVLLEPGNTWIELVPKGSGGWQVS